MVRCPEGHAARGARKASQKLSAKAVCFAWNAFATFQE